MRKFINVSLWVLTLLPLLSATSCEKDRHGYGQAEKGTLHCTTNGDRFWFWAEKPETIKLFFFPTSGTELKNGEIGIEGGTVYDIPENRYDLIALTGNLKNISLRGMGNYHTAEIFLAEKIDKDGNSIVNQPDILYADRHEINISAERTTEQELKPASLVKCLAFRLKSVGNPPIEKYSCRLSGVASAIQLNNGVPINCNSSVLFEPEKVTNGYFSRVQIFGFSKGETTRKALLYIDCYLSNGTKKSVVLDLTEHIDLFNSDAASCTVELDFENVDVTLNPTITILDWQNGSNGNIVLP